MIELVWVGVFKKGKKLRKPVVISFKGETVTDVNESIRAYIDRVYEHGLVLEDQEILYVREISDG